MVRHLVLKLLFASATVALLSAQTKLDLQHQARGIDFTGDTYTKPIRMGASLPGTCTTVEAFILTSAPAGSNLYFCLAPNQWVLQGGSGSGGSSGTPNALSSSVSGPTLTIGSSCSPTSPCSVRVGSTVFQFTSPSNASLSGGTGTAYLYVSSSGVLTVGHNLTLTCNSGCTAASGVTAFPVGSIPLASWSATSGTWGTGTDLRALLAIDNYIAGAGLQAAVGPNSTQLNVDPTLVLERGAISGTGSTLCTDANGNATTTGCSSSGGSGLGDPGSNGVIKRTALNTTSVAGATDIEASLGFTPENAANKGIASGYAPLNSSSQVPSSNLPTASTSTAGVVKVDGSTVTINGSGVISATGSGGGGSSFGMPTTVYAAPSGFSLLVNGNSKGTITTNSDGSVTLTQADTGTTNQDWAYWGTPVTGSSSFTKSFYIKPSAGTMSSSLIGLCAWNGSTSTPGYFAFMGSSGAGAVEGRSLNLTSTSATGGVVGLGEDYVQNTLLFTPNAGIFVRWNHTPTTSPYDYLSTSVDGINWSPMLLISGTWIGSSTYSSAITSVGVCIANQSGQNYPSSSVPGTRNISLQIFGVQ